MSTNNRSNTERIDGLETEREEFMFTCSQLLQIMNTTPSKKTKLAFVDILAPRLTNPKDSSEILNQFPYASEKAQVKELLAARAKQQQLDKQKIATLEQENSVLKSKVETLETTLQSVLARLSALEAQ